ncbi:hypothetical protein CAL7716_025120 [Calothrix sp. PCC 7716]|nr:hypothetical protein CAL7716_025120 [Calothrix sp. PCC 7716]
MSFTRIIPKVKWLETKFFPNVPKLTRLKLFFRPVSGWSMHVKPYDGYEQDDIKIKNLFLTTTEHPRELNLRYKALFEYFANGFIKYRSVNGASVFYPGTRSIHGLTIEGLEGFARFFPLVAAWVASGNDEVIQLGGEEVELVKVLRQGIIAGTDPQNIEYWGHINSLDQRIVEAADIALGLWISREYLWSVLSNEEKSKVIAWLEPVAYKKVYENNWLLFPVIILKFLQSVGINNLKLEEVIKERYEKFKKNYIGEGWFNDPPKGVDYYNAWAIHYSLFWIDQIDSSFDHDFIKITHQEFIEFYKHLFSKNGFPVMGRSVCYRMAAPAPLITGTLLAPEVIKPGLAYRALDLTWRFFVEKDSLQYGSVTQGFCCKDLSVLDKYSGSGSCLWSLRSLTAAFYVSKFIPFWQSFSEKLPIEISDFSVVNDSIGWKIKGNYSTQTIEIYLLKEQGNKKPRLKKYGIFNQVLEVWFKRPFRPDNYKALYRRPVYSTASTIVKCNKSKFKE